MKKNNLPQIITRIAVLSALASVLYIFPEITVIPPIYKLDFSTLPALLGGYALGPWYSLLIIAIKDLIGLTHTTTMGVGELADLLMSGSFCLAASFVFRAMRNRKGALIGSIAGIVTMVLVAAAANYYIMIPFYVKVMNFPLEAILNMIAESIPAVDSLWKLILLATTPFNLLKGVVICVMNLLLFRYLKNFLSLEAGNEASAEK